MKGYLTVFLAMSLSILTGFVLLLTSSVIKNAEKVRFECAVDTGMNAVLSEYHIVLYERYGLIYVDASYLGKEPSVSNIEERLRFYMEANTTQILQGKNSPWGYLDNIEVTISSFETAADQMGASMRNQAICFIQDTNVYGAERQVISQIEKIQALDGIDPMTEWSGIMEQLAGMELPMILNEKGIWEEVPLANPADWVYGLTGSDVLYLGEVDTEAISSVHIYLNQFISHRQIENSNAKEREYKQDEELFLSYLFDKMGYLRHPKEGSFLDCQLEYIAQGKDSDLENVRSVAERLFYWRFADNALSALADGDLRAQATAAAEELQVVQLKEEFKEPVVESILYACAFLESIGDLRAIYSGGMVPVRKAGHQMSVEHVLDGNLYTTGNNDGFSYNQYLACMILLEKETNINLRSMDIMEMDIRFQDGNDNFAMDWCIERYEASISAKGSYGNSYFLRRKYGYF